MGRMNNTKKLQCTLNARGDIKHVFDCFGDFQWVQAHSFLIMEQNQELFSEVVDSLSDYELTDKDISAIHGIFVTTMGKVKFLHNDIQDFTNIFDQFCEEIKNNQQLVDVMNDIYSIIGASYPEFNGDDYDKVRLTVYVIMNMSLKDITDPVNYNDVKEEENMNEVTKEMIEQEVEDTKKIESVAVATEYESKQENHLGGMDLTKFFTDTAKESAIGAEAEHAEITEQTNDGNGGAVAIELGEKIMAYGKPAHKVIRRTKVMTSKDDATVKIAASTSTKAPETNEKPVEVIDATTEETVVEETTAKSETENKIIVDPNIIDVFKKLLSKDEIDQLMKTLNAVKDKIRDCNDTAKVVSIVIDTIMGFIYKNIDDATKRLELINAFSSANVKVAVPVSTELISVGTIIDETEDTFWGGPKYEPNKITKPEVSSDERIRDLQTMSKDEFYKKYHDELHSEVGLWGMRDVILASKGLRRIFEDYKAAVCG